MKYTQLFPKPQKREFKEDLSVNAKLLVQGGFVDQLMSGSYSLLPLGWMVIEKIKKIVREEMNDTGAQEILMPLLHPKEIWNETGRWDSAKEVMYQFKKGDKEFALSFTHEEILLDLVRKNTFTYRDYPVKLYHFSTKFRNEPRAKSGLLRGREFMMKDLYSLHASEEDFEKYYKEIIEAYKKVFKRLEFEIVITEASGGVFTKKHSHEFQAISDVGEDEIIYCPGGDYAENVEIAQAKEGQQCSLGHGPLKRVKTIEVGNIFSFGQEYSEKMKVQFTSDGGKQLYPYFGSYGIGITRAMATAVELYHDDRGIIWPKSIAPFTVYLIDLTRSASSGQEGDQGEEIYKKLKEAEIEVLFDDRDVSAGEKFATADLLGIPYRLVVSEKTRSASSGQAGEMVEVKERKSNDTKLMSLDEVLGLS